MHFPRTVDEITPEWLTQVLRDSGAIGEASVESFTVANVGDAQGVASDINRIVVTYDRQEDCAPPSVIAKLATADERRRVLFAGVYEREVRFYQKLAPVSGMRTPKHHFSGYDVDSVYVILLLEDLTNLRAVDQSDDCSYADASAASQRVRPRAVLM